MLPARTQRLTKTSRSDRWVFGVCGGVARWMGIDPFIVRIAAVVGTYFTGFFPVVFTYFALVIFMPREDRETYY